MDPTWRTSLAVFIGLLQIQALISARTTFLTGTEGQKFDFKCEYSTGQENNTKYFYYVKDNELKGDPIQIDKHDEWKTKGRFSLYDNTSGAFFVVRVDKLYLNDSGTYWCAVKHPLWPDDIHVIQMNVSRDSSVITNSTMNPSIHKFTLQLFLIAVLCVAAILFVCMFSLLLLMVVKQQRSDQSKKKQTSSDYEMMKPGVQTKTEPCCCSHSSCTGLSVPQRPPAALQSNLTSQHRESTISVSCSDYADVDVQALCQYQHLDRSQLDEHIYHGLHINCNPKQTIH